MHKNNDGKVLFDSLDAAESCARVLQHAGSDPMYPYLCKRSEKGHWHLATEPPPGEQKPTSPSRESRSATRP
jgi:hypothetical protein